MILETGTSVTSEDIVAEVAKVVRSSVKFRSFPLLALLEVVDTKLISLNEFVVEVGKVVEEGSKFS